MKHRFIKNDDQLSINGTSLKSHIRASYNELVNILGEHHFDGDEYKVSTEWEFVKDDLSAVFTIYDWKETDLYDQNYLSVDELRSDKVIDWHIGGFDQEAAHEFAYWIQQQLGRS